MYEEKPKNPTRSVATENAVGIGAGAQIRRLLQEVSMFKKGTGYSKACLVWLMLV